MIDELYQFLACDYYATGEGRTLCLLITRAYPYADDYEGEYPNHTIKNSAKFRAARQFVEEFGSYYAQGAENLTREEFVQKFGRFIPDPVLQLLNSEDQPGNLSFKQQFHFNFS